MTTVQAQCEAKANDHWRTITGLLPGLSFISTFHFEF